MPYLILFGRLIVRPLRAEPARTALTVLAVALGVAVVLAIEMAGEAAAGSFQSSVETLAGRADFEITAPGGVPPQTLATLSLLPYPLELQPRIEDFATEVKTGRTLPLIGTDLLMAEGKDGLWVTSKLGWKKGEKVDLLINDEQVTLTVAGVLPYKEAEALAVDLSFATRLLRRSGDLDRILVRTPQARSTEEWESLFRSALGPGVTLARYGARTEENRRMLAAFRWNLRVLSYIALVVGAFLIYNTISVSVVRRRTEIGVVRALGATRSAVVVALTGEAVLPGLVGSLLGLLLGRVLAQGAVGLVAMTVESLYVSSRPGEITLTPTVAVFGVLLGVGTALLAALAPAIEAAHVPPVEAMSRGRREHEVRLRSGRRLLLAGALAAVAAIAARQPAVDGKPLFGYCAATCLLAALAVGIAPFLSAFAAVAGRLMRFLPGAEGLLAARGLAGSLRRTSVLAGALATAVAMTAAVGIMVGSFRETVLLWLDDRLKADLYIRPAGAVRADRHPLMSADSADRIRATPAVADVDAFRIYDISYGGRPVTLAGGDMRVAGMYSRRSFVSGKDPASVFRQMTSGQDAVLVSEPFANKHNVRIGDTLELQPGGRRVKFRVLDIYYDYASERGYILMDRRTLLRYLPDTSASSVAVYLRAGVSLEDGQRAVEQALSGRKLMIFTNRTLRQEAIRTFDRTFAITYALEAVAVLVAVMGVAGALLALVIDRRREIGLLRFLGGSTGQIRRLLLAEAGLLGFFANLVGLVLGFLLSLILIYVINKQSFGWTIQFHWPVAVLPGALFVVFLATIASALYPARVASRLKPIEVIHEE